MIGRGFDSCRSVNLSIKFKYIYFLNLVSARGISQCQFFRKINLNFYIFTPNRIFPKFYHNSRIFTPNPIFAKIYHNFGTFTPNLIFPKICHIFKIFPGYLILYQNILEPFPEFSSKSY